MASRALILDRDPAASEAVRVILSCKGLKVVVASSAAAAQRLLATGEYALAILDMAPDGASPDPGRREVLRQLARDHRHALTVVSDERVGDLTVAGAIHAAHPMALTHDKRLGPPSLATRLGELLNKEVGDLALDQGRVVHLPSSQSFTAQVGAQLMLAHPRWTRIERDGAGSVGLTRFRRWLRERGSVVSVVTRGSDSHYRLEVDTPNAGTVNQLLLEVG